MSRNFETTTPAARITRRVVGALASAVITFGLLHSVAMLAADPATASESAIASAPAATSQVAQASNRTTAMH